MFYVNLVLSVALLLAVFNVHLGIVIAVHCQNVLYGLLNWSMALILLITAIQKM